MPDFPLPPPMLVSEAGRLQDLARLLAGAPRVAVDTESNSLYAYRERICLIQFSVPEADYLVDPLSLQDVSPLGPVLASPSIEKVFHAAEYDLACLRRDFGFRVANLFDTRVASRTLGRSETGLGDLLSQEFGMQLNKRLQRANWGTRPLSQELLDYARLDTHYLLPLRDRLASALQDVGRWDEARELCVQLERMDHQLGVPNHEGFWRLAPGRHLSPGQLSLLRELYSWREEVACQLDRPPFKVMIDKTLVAIAQANPEDLKALTDVPGVSDTLARRHGQAILACLSRGRSAKPPVRPPGPAFDQDALARFERLREWRKRVARKRRVESDVVLPRETMWSIARHAPADLEQLNQLMSPLEWRWRTYGREILRVLQSEGDSS